jgi:dolichyl-phosphate beta-glucosyltransferase
MPTLAIIIPCYNEEKRLDGVLLAQLIKDIDEAHIHLVNDGSSDGTLDLLYSLRQKHPDRVSVISFEKNEGKAKAIAKGIREVLSQNAPDYIGYMDADFSTPIKEFHRLFDTIVREQAGFIFGSRIKKLNSGLDRTVFRHIVGRGISTFIDSRFKLGIYDTQCGAKIFSSQVVNLAFDSPFYANWLFDAEIFIRLKKNNILHTGIEMPIAGWKDVGGSKLGWKSFPKIFREFLLLSRKY